jgi:signal transduction histidine kinase
MLAERERTELPVSSAHEREVLRQAGIALHGRVVTLWEISPTTSAVPLFSSVQQPPAEIIQLDLESTLRRWGAPIVQKSRWVGCRLADDGHWVVAPVRARPAAPPPSGIERRSRERLVLELAGLSIGAISAANGAHKRLSPADALWELARQPSVIAHEVGNPLAIALGNLDLSIDAVRGAAALDPAFRAAVLADLSNVAEGIERAADYLRAIQDRPFGGAGRLGRFDVTPVIRSCVTLERPLARKRGVALKWESSVESLYLYGESGALYQVLTNLIRNAVDASRDRNAMVMIGLDRDGDTLRLSVRDNGDGISAEHRERIFEQGFTTKPVGKGTGTGLAVVKEITENMFGGSIHVESRPGAGSTFLLTLPIPPQRNAERNG